MLHATSRQRPWHRALIAERAARYHLDRGLTDGGRRLLGEARRLYDSWGASAKVRELEQEYPFLRSVDRSPRGRGSYHSTTNVSSDAIDLLAILKASQALSSATNLVGLQSRVVQVLSEMTGATSVRLLLWNDDGRTWFLPARDDTDEAPITVDAAAELGLLPLAAFRYVERTREPLLVADATQDDRFARDPYVTRLDRCSLLVVMILIHGVPRAVLMLENSLSRGVFSAERLDAVELVAGQLAVSLDNAMVYASLEQKVAERTEALAVANAQLELLSITDPLTGLPNRRQLAHTLETEWDRALDAAGPMAAAMIDIDHFKAYNDHYGHQAGDACLQRVAEALRATVRDTDLVTRYGGEEFAMILPGADFATAFQVAERARAAVAALNEEHAGSAAGVVTVSVGVAAVVASERATVDQLIERADAELYQAKRNGRNQVAGTRA
jgi:diguanylate cyclase (GGDEF)-like protein